MIIQLDLESDIPIYRQLVNQIIEGIATGLLNPGEQLPSVRSLAADLGINLHTVNKAYTHLKQEGFLQIHRQKGALIQPHSMPQADTPFKHKLMAEVRPLAAEAICRGMNEDAFIAACRAAYSSIHHNKGGTTP
ncbi:GntR family transcriptional regulator [Paenibacillus sambharensis]|uniref:GntR family transcriptional regulator n=1 Tax=Paenibacillus sambharensis TaxID=1803190 RepID=A0A2W1LNA5_9BACL|nr:GntR family transcriptional regulator [Paenibacillus sambharensis]PZD96375.1 GntR family transcriptional regulator [Paenibacillus sambharensis]